MIRQINNKVSFSNQISRCDWPVLDRHYLLSKLLEIYLFLLIFGVLMNNIINYIDLPKLFSVFRLLVLFCIVLLILYKNETKIKPSFLMMLCLFSFTYLLISLAQGKIGMGIYYLRVYLEPIIVLYFVRYHLAGISSSRFIIFIRKIGMLAFVCAVITVFAYYYDLRLVNYFHNSETISSSHFLYGAFIYRAWLPIGCSNQLGLLFSALFMINLVYPMQNKVCNLLYSLILIIGVVLTFSKSSALSLVIFYLLFNMQYKSIQKTIITMVCFLLMLFSFLYVINYVYPNNNFNLYLARLIEGADPSTIGHHESIKSAISNYKEYYLFGYERGTVGPRAINFTDEFENVENSLISIVFDMGIINAMIYFILLGSLLLKSRMTKIQLYYYMSILVPFLFLPHIYNVEITATIFFLSLLFHPASIAHYLEVNVYRMQFNPANVPS